MGEVATFFANDIKYYVDPLKKFSGVSTPRLVEALGFIPGFIYSDVDDVVETALANYGYNIGGPMVGGEIDKDGMYSYPGDPDLYPITRCVADNKTIYIYEYGIISFVDNDGGETVTYRFD